MIDRGPPSDIKVAHDPGRLFHPFADAAGYHQLVSALLAVSERGSPLLGAFEVDALSDAGQGLTADGPRCRPDSDPA